MKLTTPSTIDTTLFNQQGYQVFRGVLDPVVVAEVRTYLQALVDAQVAAACREIGCPGMPALVEHIRRVAAGEQNALKNLSKETSDTLSGHFSTQARLSPELLKIPRQAGLQEVLRAVLGDERLFLHMPPTARFVLPGNIYAAVPAHQDAVYNKHMSNFVTIWVPLVPIDDECGGIRMFKGIAPEYPIENDPSNFWHKSVPADGRESEDLNFAVGDLVAIHPLNVHQSRMNRSARVRFSIDFRFFGGRDTSTKHHLDLQTWQVIKPKT